MSWTWACGWGSVTSFYVPGTTITRTTTLAACCCSLSPMQAELATTNNSMMLQVDFMRSGDAMSVMPPVHAQHAAGCWYCYSIRSRTQLHQGMGKGVIHELLLAIKSDSSPSAMLMMTVVCHVESWREVQQQYTRRRRSSRTCHLHTGSMKAFLCSAAVLKPKV